MTTALDAKLFIKQATAAQLAELITCLNARRTVLDGEAQFVFKVKDPVKFPGRGQDVILGHIDSFKSRGRVIVKQLGTGAMWTVGGSLLQAPTGGTTW